MSTFEAQDKGETLPAGRADIQDERPGAEQPPSLEAIEAGKKALFDSLGIEASSPEEFREKFWEAVRSLPQYAEVWEATKDIPVEGLTKEIFGRLKRSSDAPLTEDKMAGPVDGVLIRSIRETGALECAGRTFIAGDILKRRGVSTSVVKAPGHTFLINEAGNGKLEYFDPNNDTRFTFPKESLAGYRGAEEYAECRLQAFESDPADEMDGFGRSVFTEFVTTPVEEGVLLAYFGNVRAALAGRKEFTTSKIRPDAEAERGLYEFERSVIGKADPTIDRLNERMDQIQLDRKRKNESDIKRLLSISETHKDKVSWIEAVAEEIKGDFGADFPYLQKASAEVRRESAAGLWEKMQDPRMVAKFKEIL